MKKFELSETLITNLIAYLQDKPYSEIANIMMRLNEELKPQLEGTNDESENKKNASESSDS